MLRGLRPEPLRLEVRIRVLTQLRARGTPRANATWDTQHARSLTVRSVERSAAACSASGISFTCTTIFIPEPYAGH